MTFSDPKFYLIFLPLCLIGFQLLGRFGKKGAIPFLSAMSLIFYGAWSKRYVLLLLGSIGVNYLFSIAIERTAAKERLQEIWLTVGIGVNLAALMYFKYLFPTLNLFASLTHRSFGDVILPLGISFFTFTQIAYLVDLKQGVAKREGILSYVLFVTYFPHLIAGPIIHNKEMMPQFRREGRYQLNRQDMSVGLTWFAMGMFKKVMVADRISDTADAFFKAPHGVGLLPAWQGVLTYAMQLYFDFSGYSDMAVGLARMFSIKFPLNFDSPYKSASIIDFWQRWHMTLTNYIMSYLYTPMLVWISGRRMDRGKKVSKKATATLDGFTQMIAVPTLITLGIAGIWHGAGVQFLLYGLLHGTYLTVNHAWRTFVPKESWLKRVVNVPVSVGITFVCVLVGEVLFRAHTFRTALVVYGEMIGRHGLGRASRMGDLLLIATLLGVVWLMPNTQEILGEIPRDEVKNWSLLPNLQWQPTLLWWMATTGAFALSMLFSTANSTFLYFQF